MPLGWRSPWDKKKPNIPQQRFLKAAFRPCKGIAITHMIGGRDVSKTTSMMLALVHSAMKVNPGLLHLWTEPTFDDCTKVFLAEWEQYVPDSWYHHNASKRIIYLRNEHTRPTPILYRGRDVSNQNRTHGRGPNLAALFFDELRQDPTDKEWRASLPMVRHPRAKHLMICTGSTPIDNWYRGVVERGVEDGRAVMIHGTSWDNPHISRDVISDMVAGLDEQWIRQEHYGEWVQLTGRVWEMALVTKDPKNHKYDWPAGNMHPHRFDPSLPFTLSVDFGVRSAWLIWQTVPASRMPGSPLVDVCVGQYTPNFGDTEMIALQVQSDFGIPSRVVCGADANTSYDWQGKRTSMFIMRNIGWDCSIRPITGFSAAKTTQLAVTRGQLQNGSGQRTLCVSKHLITKHPNNRGIIEVLNNDSWPKKEKAGELLPKDKDDGPGYEDTRDAMQYFEIDAHPPRGKSGIGRMHTGA